MLEVRRKSTSRKCNVNNKPFLPIRLDDDSYEEEITRKKGFILLDVTYPNIPEKNCGME